MFRVLAATSARNFVRLLPSPPASTPILRITDGSERVKEDYMEESTIWIIENGMYDKVDAEVNVTVSAKPIAYITAPEIKIIEMDIYDSK